MAYIGKQPVVGNFQVCDAITVVNGQAAYTMQVSSANVDPENANHMLVSLNGVLQKPGSSFTISGATITFASNLATGDVIDFIILLGNVLDIGTPSDGTVTTAKLGADAVTAAKIADDAISEEHLDATVITGNSAETSIATDDLILISDTSDSAALKKMTQANFTSGLGGLTEADQWRMNSNSSDNTADGVITQFERTDTDGFDKLGTGMSESSGIFTFPSTGYWWIIASFVVKSEGSDTCHINLQTTVNNSSYGDAAAMRSHDGATRTETTGPGHFLFDVTSTTDCKVRFNASSFATSSQIYGDSGNNISTVTFLKLGAT